MIQFRKRERLLRPSWGDLGAPCGLDGYPGCPGHRLAEPDQGIPDDVILARIVSRIDRVMDYLF